MGKRAGIGRQAEQLDGQGRRGAVRDVTGGSGGMVAAWPPPPTVVDRVLVGEAPLTVDISVATERRRIRTGGLVAERLVRHGGATWAVQLPAGADGVRRLRGVAPDGLPSVERVVPAIVAAGGGVALWWSMATLAHQLAAANASQARARQALERENRRLAVALEDATAALAIRTDEHAPAGRRAWWPTYGALLVAAGLGALLLVLGPLAASDVAGLPRRLPKSVPSAPPVTADHPASPAAESIDRAWGRDWPLAIRLLEEREARQPGDPVVRDKLYAAYVEHAKALWREGALPSARGRLGQARDYDPDRGVAELVQEALERGTPPP